MSPPGWEGSSSGHDERRIHSATSATRLMRSFLPARPGRRLAISAPARFKSSGWSSPLNESLIGFASSFGGVDAASTAATTSLTLLTPSSLPSRAAIAALMSAATRGALGDLERSIPSATQFRNLEISEGVTSLAMPRRRYQKAIGNPVITEILDNMKNILAVVAAITIMAMRYEAVAEPSKSYAKPRHPIELFGEKDLQKDLQDRGEEIRSKESEIVLTAIFPKRLRDLSECGDYSSIDEARKTGNIVPGVLAKVEGSFTGVGLKETIYTVLVGECGATPLEGFGTHKLALFRAGKLVFDIESYGEVKKAIDINYDDRDEVLLSGGTCELGNCRKWIQIVEVNKHGVNVLHDPGDVYESECGLNGDGHVNWKSVTSMARDGKFVVLTTEHKDSCSRMKTTMRTSGS